MKKIVYMSFAFLILGFLGFAQADTYRVDSKASKIEWKGEKKVVNSNHIGTIGLKSGKIDWKDGKIVGGEFVIDMKTISNTDLSGNKKDNLEGHLNSADFFDVEKFPTARFKITNVTDKSENEFEVMGELTIKGKTQPNSFTVETEMKDGKLHGKGKTTFDRSKFDVKYASESFFDIKKLGDKVIKNEIELEFSVMAQR